MLALALFGIGLMVAEAFVPAFGAFVRRRRGGLPDRLADDVPRPRASASPRALVCAATLVAAAGRLGVVLAALLRRAGGRW